jgi:hypothetical protein
LIRQSTFALSLKKTAALKVRRLTFSDESSGSGRETECSSPGIRYGAVSIAHQKE